MAKPEQERKRELFTTTMAKNHGIVKVISGGKTSVHWNYGGLFRSVATML
ncbi:hypothetical protein [Chryseobacterium camelliae]|nr:hypothetical protein [Chryseobacterium camelliae]MDR6514689.1 hypothetical protein [Chryseobacterium camelliae]